MPVYPGAQQSQMEGGAAVVMGVVFQFSMIRRVVRQNAYGRVRRTSSLTPTRREDSTAAAGIRRTDWRWAFVFKWSGEAGDA